MLYVFAMRKSKIKIDFASRFPPRQLEAYIYKKHAFLVGFRLYGHVHLLSQVISHRLDGSVSKVTIFWFVGPKMSKLAFGSVKNESGARDLPQDASIYRWPHLFIDGRIYLQMQPHLFIDGRIYLQIDRHLFIDSRIYLQMAASIYRQPHIFIKRRIYS